MKTCTKCGMQKSPEAFFRHHRTKDGLRQECKQCTNEINRKWQVRNPEKVRDKATANYWRHRTAYLAKQKETRDPERALIRGRAWNERNREKRRRLNREYYRRNRGKVNAITAEWRRRNPEKVKRYARTSYLKRRKVRVENQRYDRREHQDRTIADNRNRRARIAGAVGKFTAQEWRALKAQYCHKCLCCYRREPDIKLTPDHIEPITLGGTNLISNIQPLCLSCNSSKGIKTTDYRVNCTIV